MNFVLWLVFSCFLSRLLVCCLPPGGEGPGHVDEVMETGSEAPEEEVLLDENKEAKGVEFSFVGEVKVNVWSTVIILGSVVSCPYTFLFIMELFYKYRSAYVVCWFDSMLVQDWCVSRALVLFLAGTCQVLQKSVILLYDRLVQITSC